MILQKTQYNNGYGCSCCASYWDDSEWINENDILNPQELCKEIEDNRKSMSSSHLVEKIYEKDGKTLYGYSSDCYKVGEDTYIVIGDNKYLYKTSLDKAAVPSYEIKELLQNFYNEIMKKS